MQPTLTAPPPPFTERRYLLTLVFVVSLFMLWGVGVTMGDILNKHFQEVLHVSKADSALVQLSIFGAYFVMGLPAGWFMKRFGYQKGVLLGLGLYALGAFLMVPAATALSFGYLRLALFVLACGLATLEAVAHPFLDGLGDPRTSDRRINFAHAINGIGAVSGPLIGGYFVLRGTHAAGDLASVKILYAIIGAVVGSIGLAFFFVTVPALNAEHTPVALAPAEAPTDLVADKQLFQHRHFVWACVAQFFNTAAQGGTWAFFINYGVEYTGLTNDKAAYFFSLSLVGMMLGRFLGTYLMQFIAPNRLLAAVAVANIGMCLVVAQHWGLVSFVALILLNFFFSIMFPTIYSLGLKDLGRHKQLASSFIVMGVVGAALFPRLMGLVANTSVAHAYYLPIVCYVVVFLFGARLYKVQRA
ncbi:MFS transporter [Hymenobacter terricola]|uniref:MFS transporter n=1 Tax=Hymenobacter terricola TaxID=2819236 RepID=UPI001CF291AA|nr:MFS transporter [Hymenobacter terricola]